MTRDVTLSEAIPGGLRNIFSILAYGRNKQKFANLCCEQIDKYTNVVLGIAIDICSKMVIPPFSSDCNF